MFTSKEEQDFFMSHLDENTRVLEYGSGESTIEISKIVKKIVSIEHQKVWYDKVKSISPSNCDLILQIPDEVYDEGGLDGTYEQFKSYINSPVGMDTFDIILIDGRARVECAKVCSKFSNENTIIFVHDFFREEYQEIKNFLDIVEIKGTMAKFKIKK